MALESSSMRGPTIAAKSGPGEDESAEEADGRTFKVAAVIRGKWSVTL